MNPYISRIFGRKPITTDTTAKLLASHNAERDTLRKTLADLEATLSNPAILTDAEHKGAEEQHDATRRALLRVDAQIAELQTALGNATKAEARAALDARAKTARHAVEVEAAGLLAKYDEHAAAVAAILARLKEIETERDAVNTELLKARLPAVLGVDDVHRRELDTVTPEQRSVTKEWRFPDGRQAMVMRKNAEGRLVPEEIGAIEVEVEHVTPETRTPGRRLPPLDEGSLKLPPGRVGVEPHWPRAKKNGGRS